MIVVEGEFSPLDQIGYSLHLLHVFIRHFGPPYKKMTTVLIHKNSEIFAQKH